MKREAKWVMAAAGLVVVCVGVGIGVTATRSTSPAETAPAASSGSAKLLFSKVTVTAAAAGHESAVAMSIDNQTGGPISLVTVASPVSGMNMLYYDANMCQGNTAMTWLPNILISTKQVQLLGYKNQGVMLSRLHERLVVGTTVPLRITYSDFSNSHTVTVDARVVAPPKGLHFLMSAMRM